MDREDLLWSAICELEDAINTMNDLGGDYVSNVAWLKDLISECREELDAIDERNAQEYREDREALLREYYASVL